MASAVPLRGDYGAGALRELAKRCASGSQTRRLLALAEIYDGGTRGDAARIGGVGLQTVRDWVPRFNGEGPAGLVDGKAPGAPPKLNQAQRQAVARMVESGPLPAVHGVVPLRQVQEAADRSGAMGVGRIRHFDQQADAVAGVARARLS